MMYFLTYVKLKNKKSEKGLNKIENEFCIGYFDSLVDAECEMQSTDCFVEDGYKYAVIEEVGMGHNSPSNSIYWYKWDSTHYLNIKFPKWAKNIGALWRRRRTESRNDRYRVWRKRGNNKC